MSTSLQRAAHALGGEVVGAQVLAPGPNHSQKDRSLSIKFDPGAPDGFVVYSFSGDDPILCKEYVRAKLSLVRREATSDTPPKRRADHHHTKRTKGALAIWDASGLANGTPVETYLASRGLRLSPPQTLRFQAGLKHPSGGVWPAMVALVTRGSDDTPLAIHRTFLAPRRRRQGAGRSAEDDARPLPWRRCAACSSRRCPDGRRGHRDLPRRHAGERPSGLGGAFDFRAAGSRSAA